MAQEAVQVAGPPVQDIVLDSRVVTVFGLDIHYIAAGAGPALILLHGLANDWTVWSRVIAPLARHRRVIAIDQIGFGKSAKPLIEYRLETFVDFLAGFCQAIDVRRASIAGSSFGGWVAAEFALQYPHRVETLVLADAIGVRGAIGGNGSGAPSLRVLNLSSRAALRALMPVVFHNAAMFDDDETVEAVFTQRLMAGDGYAVSRLLASFDREAPLDDRLAALTAPTLIVWGRQDRLVPVEFGQRFHEAIPQSRLAILDDCGHMPSIERSEEFCAVVTEFLSNCPAAGGVSCR